MLKDIKLYDAANSPCGRRARLTLIEKGIPFKIHWVNLALTTGEATTRVVPS